RGHPGTGREGPRPAGPPGVSQRFVIVGAALTGGTAAVTLRHQGFEGSLTVIGSELHLPYERPPLSKAFLRGEAPFEDALVRPEGFYKDSDVELRLGTTATAVDPHAKRVTLADGEQLPYDRLLLATGARNRHFPIPGLDLEGVHSLRTVDESEAIRKEISPGRRAAVVGMGFIGSEVAASLRQRGVEVTAVDGGSVPLERILGEPVGRVLEGIHRDNGVQLLFNDRLAAIEGHGRVERVRTAAGRTIECEFAVLGLGVEPVTELAASAGVEVDNGIVVDERCRTNVPDIYAAGDVANHYHPVFRRRMRTEHWLNARRQGRAAALSMLNKGGAYDEVPWFWSDQYDQNLQYAGYHTEWDDIVVRGSLDRRSFVALYMSDGRVQAVAAMNRGREVTRSIGLIEAGAQGAALDPGKLRDEAVDLEDLARKTRV
ncbi:MAG TPA: FAD-dependent oxidoreductase, partial [Actinomycetota bacterium]|nr:FAD-dependent oxidoreductase [Actinomycetota bacterium]